MAQRGHRWKNWVENESTLLVLEEAALELKAAWDTDKKSPEHYPMHTEIVFSETMARLRGELPNEGPIKLPPPQPPPRRFCELVDEQTIKAVYEDQNNGSYQEALRIAASWHEQAYPTFRKLLRAVAVSYEIHSYGSGAIPKPRTHFLHKNLLEIADKVLAGLKLEGILEFLDDTCPCGRLHQADAIRKFRKRRSGEQ